MLLLTSLALAVPMQLDHQGRVMDAATGLPLTNTQFLTFTLYDAETGGASLWTDTLSVDFDEGYYSTTLDGVDTDVFDRPEVWIGVTVGTGAELTRHRIESVPYALLAQTATNLSGGVVDASEIRVDGNVVIDSTGSLATGPTLGDLSCNATELALYDGTDWTCSAPVAADWNTLANIPTVLQDGDIDWAELVGVSSVLVDGQVDWVELNGVPAELADGLVDWSELGGIPADLQDGSIDWSELAGVPLDLQDGSIDWSELSGVPSDFADGSIDWSELSNVSAAFADGDLAWAEIVGIPNDIADGDDVLSEADVETFVTNGPLALDSGTTLDGMTAADIIAAAEQNVCENQLDGVYNAGSGDCVVDWWNGSWSYRTPVDVTAGSVDVPAGSVAFVTIDHAALVGAGKSAVDGSDLYLVYDNGVAAQIDRHTTDPWNGTVTLAFSVQSDIPSGATDEGYSLYYGNPAASGPQDDPRAIYWLFDDFEDGDYTSGESWTVNHGSWSVNAGYLEGETYGSGDNAEVGIYAGSAGNWTDVVVEMAIYDDNTGPSSYPGPFLRMANAANGSTTAWWFEYHTNAGGTNATMRPFTGNTDHGWTYNVGMSPVFTGQVWHDCRYEARGNQIWSSVDGQVVHNGTTVSGGHMVNSGILGLGMHKNSQTNGIRYDDIRVYQSLADQPTTTPGVEQSL